MIHEELTDKIIKAFYVENIAMAHEAQLINYLKATEKEVGLLLNFGNNQNFP